MNRVTFGCLFVCCAGHALAQTATDPIWRKQAKQKYEHARMHRAEGNVVQALALMEQALQEDDTELTYHIELAELHAALEAPEKSIEVLERAEQNFPNEPSLTIPLIDAHLHRNTRDRRTLKRLGRKLSTLRALTDVESRIELRREIILRQAHIARQLRLDEEALRRIDEWRGLSPGQDRFNLEMGHYHLDFGRIEDAKRAYEMVREAPHFEKARHALESIQRNRYQRYHPFLPPSAPLPSGTQADLLAAEEFIATGNIARCSSILDDLLTQHPTSIRVLRLRGDCHRLANDFDSAELFYLRALSMNPSEHDVLVALTALHESQEKWAFVIEFADRALELPNVDLKQIHLRRIEAYRRLGRPNDALRMVNAAIKSMEAQEDIPVDDLRILKRELILATTVDSPFTTPSMLRDPKVADVRRLMAADAFEDALKTIEQVRPNDRSAELHALHGRILFVLNRVEQARVALERALKTDPHLVQANLILAQILLLNPATAAQAFPYLDAASRAGSLTARTELIRLNSRPAPEVPFLHDLVNLARLIHWTDELEQMSASPAAPRDDIAVLMSQLEERIQRTYFIAGILSVLLVTLVVLALRKRFGGATLHDLMARYPTTNPETHRILSAIRHEVLKHNSTALQGLLHGLENGDDISEQADWCYQALIGHDSTDQGSAHIRLMAYVEQLLQLGKSHGLRLNLTHRDPAIAPILRGFRLLRSMERHFKRVSQGHRKHRAMRRKLRVATRLINGVGFRQILLLLKALRNLTIDASICTEIFQSVRQEPAFSYRDVEFHFDADPGLLPLELPVAREDFEDILRNPIRNAIQATASETLSGTIHVGLDIRREIEDITGEISTVFMIKDRCPRSVPSSTLTTPDPERGLGITHTLVTKYDGTLEVSTLDSPWSKGLVVSLPWDEAPAEQWEL